MYEMQPGQIQQQKQTLSRGMVQSAQILQLDIQELYEYVQQEALENPMIDLDDMENRLRSAGSGEDAPSELFQKLEWLSRVDEQNRSYYSELQEEAQEGPMWNAPVEEGSLAEHVMSQLLIHAKRPEDRRCLEFLVYNLDSRGYLEEDPAELRQALGIDEAAMGRYLAWLQSAEPAGVGARSLEECLVIQIQRRAAAGLYTPQEAQILTKLSQNHLSNLGKRHFSRVAGELGLSADEVARYYALLKGLNPIPGNAFSSRSQPRYIHPDAAVVPLGDRLEVVINEQDLPRISVNQSYLAMMHQEPGGEVEAYLVNKFKQAQWVQHCIEERSATLCQVVTAIVQAQAEFFAGPQGQRLPLSMKDIAASLGIHESTVSRAVKNKYLQCPRGVYPMSYFFTQQIASDQAGNAMTPEQAKEKIRTLISTENKQKPLSDQKLANLLQAEGVQLSRRTIAKYRAELNLPDASGRKIRG